MLVTAKGGAAKPTTPAKGGTAAKPAKPAKVAPAGQARHHEGRDRDQPLGYRTRQRSPAPSTAGTSRSSRRRRRPSPPSTTTIGASVTNLQAGIFGGTATDPYLVVVTGDHSKNPTAKAMDLLKNVLKDRRNQGLAVSQPFFVPHTPWGGSAACATEAGNNVTSGVDESVVICTWVDNNTLGAIFAPHRIAAQAPALLNSVRSQVEH